LSIFPIYVLGYANRGINTSFVFCLDISTALCPYIFLSLLVQQFLPFDIYRHLLQPDSMAFQPEKADLSQVERAYSEDSNDVRIAEFSPSEQKKLLGELIDDLYSLWEACTAAV